MDVTPSWFAFSSDGNPDDNLDDNSEKLDDNSMSPTTIRRRPKQRKTTTPELPKKGRLQQSTPKITRVICMLAVKGPSYIWRDPMTEICALQLSAQFGM